MSVQPRDQNGNFISTEVVSSDGEIIFYIAEYEARVIAGRLSRAQQRNKGLAGGIDTPLRFSQDCKYWKEKFDSALSTRAKCDDEYYENGDKRHIQASDNIVKVKLTDYECWSLGNRLYEIGEWFKQKGYERVAQETQWLARRFHAEKKQQKAKQ